MFSLVRVVRNIGFCLVSLITLSSLAVVNVSLNATPASAATKVFRTIPVGSSPTAISSDGSNVWVANFESDSITEINSATGAVTSTISVQNQPSSLWSDGNDVWVSNSTAYSVTEIDAHTGAVIRTIVLGLVPGAIYSDGTDVWVVCGTNQVCELDGTTGFVLTKIPVGAQPSSIASDGSHIWVTNSSDNTVTEIDKKTETVMATINVGSSPDGVSADASDVWVANFNSSNVSEISVSTGQVVATIPVGAGPCAISDDGTYVWVTDFSQSSVSEINISTGTVVKTVSSGVPGPIAVTSDGTNVWVVSPTAGTVEEFGTGTTISDKSVSGINVPLVGATPVTSVRVDPQYTGTVTWSPSATTFAANTVYTATIRLTPKAGYTFGGDAANSFSVSGASTVTNDINSGVITAVFPATGYLTLNNRAVVGVTQPVTGAVPASNATSAGGQYTGVISWSGNPATFAPTTSYTATITLTPAAGYTFSGVPANYFTVAGATSSTNAAGSGVVTAVFPATSSVVVSQPSISGVTVPVSGAVPSTTISPTSQYTGVVTWSGNPSTFAPGSGYTATITLTPAAGYTFSGVPANFFTVPGATSVTNGPSSGIITAVFPQTGMYAVTHTVIGGITAPIGGSVPVPLSLADSQYTGSVTWTPVNSSNSPVTTYTATITLTPAAGYTFSGIPANYFTVPGAAVVTNAPNSGVVTAVYGATTQVGAVSQGGVPSPTMVTADAGHVYVASAGSTTITELNALTGAPVGTISASGVPSSISSDGTDLWVATTGSNIISEYNIASGSLVTTITASGVPSSISSDGTDLWVAVAGANSLYEYSSGTGLPVGSYQLSSVPVDVASNGSHVWVVYSGSSSLTQFDIASHQVLATVQVGGVPTSVSTGGSEVWASVNTGNALYEVNDVPGAINSLTVTDSTISGISVPTTGATPTSVITPDSQFTGTVTWSSSPTTFAANTTYTATITLTPASNFGFRGVAPNSFSVPGAISTSNAANSGVIVAVFPATTSRVISDLTITSIPAPAPGATPVMSIKDTQSPMQYTATVTWSQNPAQFAPLTGYTATITLTPAPGYTFAGLSANSFTVQGATSATFAASSGVLSAVFAPTGNEVVNHLSIHGVSAPVLGATPVKSITSDSEFTGSVTWSPSVTTFAANTSYTATITLKPSTGFTFSGLSSSAFSVAGATSTSFNASSGVLTATFAPAPTVVVSDLTVNVTTVPTTGQLISTSVAADPQFSGTVAWSGGTQYFSPLVIYTATITLTPTVGYTFSGLSSNAFSVAGATSTSFNASTGVLTAMFPRTTPLQISDFSVSGLTVPAAGDVPTRTIGDAFGQYTGTVSWSGNPATFAPFTSYTATITLTPAPGYTLQGIPANSFSVAGSVSEANAANSATITVTFPATSTEPFTDGNITGLVVPVTGAVPVTTSVSDAQGQFTGAVSWSPNDGTFKPATVYSATITLTPSTGYSYDSLTQDFFNVPGADLISFNACLLYTSPSPRD